MVRDLPLRREPEVRPKRTLGTGMNAEGPQEARGLEDHGASGESRASGMGGDEGGDDCQPSFRATTDRTPVAAGEVTESQAASPVAESTAIPLSALEVSDRRLAQLLLACRSPESVLSDLLEFWVARGSIEWGSFFLRRSPGWVRLVEKPKNRPPQPHHDDLQRVLREPPRNVVCEPTPSSSTAGSPSPKQPALSSIVPERKEDLLWFSLGASEEEIARLVVRPVSPSRCFDLPRHVATSVTLFLRGLRDRETDGMLRSFARRTFLRNDEVTEPRSPRSFPNIIGQSVALERMLSLVRRAAPTGVSVLIEGESGTGKELIARAVHDLSKRATGPFVGENCAAFSPTLLESEIFGSEKGSYTGADQTRPGMIERSHGGTLFLDEIAEMDLRLQSKLLRVLQEREVRRVGGARTIPVDFRLITATHRDLTAEVKAGRFREDLLFRILVIRVDVPPLRSRRDDIPELANHFLTLFAREHGVPTPSLDKEALQLLMQYGWPGNIRELRNEMERALTLSPEAINLGSLSEKLHESFLPRYTARRVRRELGADLYDLERAVLGGVIREVLEETRGNKTRAAEILGVPKTSLYRRLDRYGIKIDGEGKVEDNEERGQTS